MPQLLIPFLLFGFFLIFYNHTVEYSPIRYWDEHTWIGRTYFLDLLIHGKLDDPSWESVASYDYPKLNVYYIGAVLYPVYLKERRGSPAAFYAYETFLCRHNFLPLGYRDLKANFNLLTKLGMEKQDCVGVPGFIDWSNPEFKFKAEDLLAKYGPGFQKTIDLVRRVKRANAVLLSLGAVIVYAIALVCFGKGEAVVGALLWGLNTLVIDFGLQAQSEALFLFLFHVGLLLLILFWRKRIAPWTGVILLSITAALCGATKLNGGMLLILFDILLIAVAVSASMSKNWKEVRNHLLYILAANTLCFLLFVALDPTSYRQPLRYPALMIQATEQHVDEQLPEYPEGNLATFKSRFYSIYDNFFTTHKRQGSPLAPVPVSNVTTYNNPDIFLTRDRYATVLAVVNIILFVLGLARVAVCKKTAEFLFLSLFVLVQAIMSVYLRLGYYWYYLPLTIFFVLFQTSGLFFICRVALRRREV